MRRNLLRCYGRFGPRHPDHDQCPCWRSRLAGDASDRFPQRAHSLAALAQEVLAEDPFSGAVIVYRAKRSDRLKILVWDSSGLVLVWKQLQQGSFRWPPIMDGVMKLSPIEFAALFDGLDWTRVQTAKGILKPSVAA